jgi:hypothetical protein
MGQYTDKINQISKDFKVIDDGESVNALQAYNGVMIISYNHGGESIEILRDNIEYQGTPYPKGYMIYTAPTDPYYIKIKALYVGKPSWAERIAKWHRNRKKVRNDKKFAKKSGKKG